MNYIGSKLSLLPFIERVVTETYDDDLHHAVFCDLFAGTGIVGRHFKPLVGQVISNDLEYYSYVLNRNYIGNHTPIEGVEAYFQELDHIPLRSDGFIFDQYSEGGSADRLYFSEHNGKKIDAIRSQIEDWRLKKQISSDLFYHLLASLLESADKVANTASVYGAFLKKLKKSAQATIHLTPATYSINDVEHVVCQRDANELIREIHGDILYLDPPYNARQYGANYHLLNTIAEYKPFEPKGKTGLPKYNRSLYCKSKTVNEQLEDLIRHADFRYIYLSYNNEGLMSISDVEEIFSRYGEYSLYQSDYKRFRADKEENRNHKSSTTTEYLHVLKKDIR